MRRIDIRSLAPIVLLSFLVSSCAAMQQSYEENPKALLGGLLGAGRAPVSRHFAGGVPARLRAAIGGARSAASSDTSWTTGTTDGYASRQQGFEQNQAGQPSVWNNPDSGNSGSVTPTKTLSARQRPVLPAVPPDDHNRRRAQTSYGTACRQADGTWKIQT